MSWLNGLIGGAGAPIDEIEWLRTENNRLRAEFMKMHRFGRLSSGWEHWPCVTTGLPDPRAAHPVLRAIRAGR